MARTFLYILTILICGQATFGYPNDVTSSTQQHVQKFWQHEPYWQIRRKLLLTEKQESLGGNLELSPIEAKANDVLMKAKSREIYNGFITGNTFLPSFNFMEVISKIEKSEVFKILRDMPKGAVLHAHESAMASFDYRFNNLTYRKNLYVCDKNGSVNLKFFKEPNNDCHWELLSNVRKNPARAKNVNEKIKQSMTMITKNPSIVYNSVDKAWEKFNSLFGSLDYLSHRPVYEDLIYRNLQELYEDNVMYAEIRATLSTLYDSYDGKSYGAFMKDHPDFIGAKIIYAPNRAVDQKKFDWYLKTLALLKQHLPDFIAGFDLVGQEDKGKPLTEFADKLKSIDPSIPFFFHSGETNWNGESTDLNLFDAVLLNTKRIGHGYALTKHPLLWKLAQQLNIAVEVCPISNQVLGLVEDMRNHPAASLFAKGSPVVVSNDDPGFWGAKGLTYDFYEAFMGIMSADSDLRSLKQLAMNSLIYSSMNDQEKKEALNQWQVKWDAFVSKQAKSA
ncbi:Adenosine deaminase CECR1 [Trachymyrmex septentrionalis]|uniref:Adenosine deaminase n=1 Tax=Trachymyrmex septentrionalis TaxID=34720 RepID=A0A195F7Y2_9HYME|nr:Adenosine deaminase CECR1 [Trachymyrmex septentrionalis]